ncbi:MAG: nicotinate phosphoribosyltransferase [Eubacterium sp.]|nr:nicotinate phosphoribosyltransferase [Eubacterium sp.]
MKDINLTLLTDFYELTMANGYMNSGMADKTAYFDVFFRNIPDKGGYAIMGGLDHIIDYLENLKFTNEDIEYLRSKKIFSEEFLDYLADFKFECDVWSVPEGTPIFPKEPVITVRGPIIQAQFVETAILMMFNHESLIATKASRIVRAAQGRAVMEFGSRRSHGAAAAMYGARAAYIGGCIGTACAIVDRETGIPALGTMAHSWVQLFPTEYEAFKAYAENYPQNCTLLVDTYDVLKSGVPNAIKIFREMKPEKMGIRIDSGDIAYLTKQARKMLDNAGFPQATITASNALDEYLIRDIILEGAKIDSFGVGERLITAKSDPVFGGVYKLSAIEDEDGITPKIKISENVGKITNPGVKSVYRIYANDSGKAQGDLITLKDEGVPQGKVNSEGVEEIEIFDEESPWKTKVITDYTIRDIRVQIFDRGKLVYDRPSVKEVQQYCMDQLETIWEETLRFENPQTYYVDLSQKLYDLKRGMLEEHRKK